MKIRPLLQIFVLMELLILGLTLPSWSSTPPDSCRKTCLVNADCGQAGFCDSQQCFPLMNYCHNERWSANDRLESQDCGALRCDHNSGRCLRMATQSLDCTAGFVFDEKGACIRSVQCSEEDPECARLMGQWRQARAEYESRTPAPNPNPLTCRSCHERKDCDNGEMCFSGRCVLDNPFCRVDTSGNHFSVSSGASEKSCGYFRCDQSRGDCFDLCFIDSECREGTKCRNLKCEP